MRVEVEIDDKLYQAIMEKEVKIGFASSFTDIFVDAIHRGNVRKTGRWNDGGTCSVCGTYSSLNLSKVKYCPECGAKMEGAAE